MQQQPGGERYGEHEAHMNLQAQYNGGSGGGGGGDILRGEKARRGGSVRGPELIDDGGCVENAEVEAARVIGGELAGGDVRGIRVLVAELARGRGRQVALARGVHVRGAELLGPIVGGLDARAEIWAPYEDARVREIRTRQH